MARVWGREHETGSVPHRSNRSFPLADGVRDRRNPSSVESIVRIKCQCKKSVRHTRRFTLIPPVRRFYYVRFERSIPTNARRFVSSESMPRRSFLSRVATIPQFSSKLMGRRNEVKFVKPSLSHGIFAVRLGEEKDDIPTKRSPPTHTHTHPPKEERRYIGIAEMRNL